MSARPTIGVDDLIIEKTEFIPIVMPLPKIFKGSNYFMSHRCTIITRIYTRCGIVGECYNGDEFEGQKAVLETLRKAVAGDYRLERDGGRKVLGGDAWSHLRHFG